MRWPDGLDSGQVIDEMISNVDVLPSVLEAAGVSVPGDVQGKSFWPLLQGGNYSPRDWVFAGKNTTWDDIKRCMRTRRYKYICNYDEGSRLKLSVECEASLTRRDMGDAHLAPRVPVELYDLEADPLERVNLAGRAEVAEAERELAEQLARFQKETHDPILKGSIERPPAEAANVQKVHERKLERVKQRDEMYPRDI
jgi:arylsulfatase A-like enzyme